MNAELVVLHVIIVIILVVACAEIAHLRRQNTALKIELARWNRI